MMDAKLQTLLEWRRGYFDERKIVASPEYSAEQENFVEACRREYVKRRAEFLKHRDYIRTMARLRATESALDNTNDELERTAAALAAAEAEVARYRAALDEVAGISGRAGFNYSGGAADVFVLICSIAATAIYIEEATHENG
jgi:hypothetical protein